MSFGFPSSYVFQPTNMPPLNPTFPDGLQHKRIIEESNPPSAATPSLIVQPNQYLESINRDIADFIDYLKRDPRLSAPRNEVFMRLDKLALDYHKCLQHSLTSHSVPKKEMELIFNSTYFDHEMLQKSSEACEPPNTLLLLIVLLQYLVEKKDRAEAESQLYKMIKTGVEVLSLIRISERYLKDYRQQVRQLIIEWIESKINKLEIGETLGLPGGWCALPEQEVEGHFLFYALKRIAPEGFEKIRINTHLMDPSLDPRPCEKTKLPKANVRCFVTLLVDSLLQDNLRRRISPMSPMKRVESLFKLNRGAHPMPVHIPFELQNQAPNCGFMAMFILYQAIIAQAQRKEPGPTKPVSSQDAYRKATDFRRGFQEYLNRIAPSDD